MEENLSSQNIDGEVVSSQEELPVNAEVDSADSIAENLNDEELDDSISFEDLGLDSITLAAVAKKGFVSPSPIQVLAIPRLLNGEANVIARARTGTGKTAAFGLPIVQRLRTESDHVRAIILEPTRELAMQTCTELASFTTGIYPRVAVVYGGAAYGEQLKQLRRGVEIVVGTPGRVQDMIDRGALDISQIEYFILDEGDEMLDMGFVDDIENIFESANPDCRVLLFSATVPKPILRIAQQFMGEYEIVEEEGHEEEPLLIEQKYWLVRESEKTEALVRLIDISPDFYGLVFVQKKTDADLVSKALDEKGYMVAALHGDIPQSQREKILQRFRSKRVRVLVATDVAARGIDIGGLTHVVNYDLPLDGPTYVHRIGRTGRAGAAGMAVTFVRPEEARRKLNFLKQAVKKSAKGEMTEGSVPSVEEVLEAKRSRLFEDVKTKLGLNPAETSEGESEASSEENAVRHLRKGDPIFDKMAEELCSGQDAQEVVASLLAATYGSSLSKKHYGKINAIAVKGEKGQRGSGSSVSDNQIRIYAQMGWNDGFNPRKIAEFVASLVHVRERDVDAIDMADNFCLFSLPKEAGEYALELSKQDPSIPHMHLDSKSVSGGRSSGRGRGFGGGRGGFGRDRGGFGGERRGRSRFDDRRDDRRGDRYDDRYDDRRYEKSFGGDRYAVGRGEDRRSSEGRGGFRSRAKGGSHSRPGVHTGTQRNSQASIYKKSSDSNEY